MNFMIPPPTPEAAISAMLREARRVLKPPPRLNLIEWADRFRFLAAKTTASPGRWKTSAQPCAFGPMAAVLRHDTHTVTVMAGTQIIKTEFLINAASYYIAQDPSAILFVQPTQSAAENFSKERFAPTVAATPQLRNIVETPKSRDSENTITHKDYPGGSLDFVGANSPTDLSSRPKRIILCDEIDKYPISAGTEGDPLKLAEERASTYKALGRAKFVRTCSPTIKGMSRVGASTRSATSASSLSPARTAAMSRRYRGPTCAGIATRPTTTCRKRRRLKPVAPRRSLQLRRTNHFALPRAARANRLRSFSLTSGADIADAIQNAPEPALRPVRGGSYAPFGALLPFRNARSCGG
jgi:hypothetical protein